VVRSLLLALVALCGLLGGTAVGGLQAGPIETVTSVVSSLESETTVVPDSGGPTGEVGESVEPDVSDGGTAGGGTDDALSGGAGLSVLESGTRPGRFASHFDRLPRRYEMLLERLELGRGVGATWARLERLLASASPELRARVARLVRKELRRLEKGGLTRLERRAAMRLRRLLRSLEAEERQGAATQAGGGVQSSPGAGNPPTDSATGEGGVASTRAGSASREAESAGSQLRNRDEATGSEPRRLLPAVIPPSGVLDWLLLLLLLLAVIGCVLLLLSAAPRTSLPPPVRTAVGHRRRELRTLAATVVLAGVAGVLVVVLLA
jgi:hypothetical protein